MATYEPGFYDDGAGRRRWHDGQMWGDRYEDEPTPTGGAPMPAVSGARAGLKAAAGRITAAIVETDPNSLWQAVGQPLTRMGVGRYRLTAEILYFEKGTISMKAQQILTHEIFDVDASQSITQKARGVGTIALHVIRPTGKEWVMLEDIADFRNGLSQINAAALAAREVIRLKSMTQMISYSGGLPPVQFPAHAPVAFSPGPVAPDLNAELGKLAAYRDTGVLSEEEFTAAKRKLLGL